MTGHQLSILEVFGRRIRVFLGTLLLGVVLVDPAAPVWLALVATYPLFAALISLDRFSFWSPGDARLAV